MEYQKKNNHYALRLDKGEEIIEQLNKFVEQTNIKTGSIVGLGACDFVRMGLFDTNINQYFENVKEDMFEITSLVGNITCKEEKVYFHLHINIADREGHVFGGHLNECRISATCELFITDFEMNVNRKMDSEIGLNLLEFVNENR